MRHILREFNFFAWAFLLAIQASAQLTPYVWQEPAYFHLKPAGGQALMVYDSVRQTCSW